MSALLRIASALDCTHDTKIKDLECTIQGPACRCVLSSERNCLEESAKAMKEKELFNQVFGLDFVIGDSAPINQNDMLVHSDSVLSAV